MALTGTSDAKAPVKFQHNPNILTFNIMASSIREISR